MAVFTVSNSGAPGSSGLTFEGAVEAAEVAPGADIIRFADDISRVDLTDVVTISGELLIDGDADHDGISDVVISAGGQSRHLNIGATADVTIRNVDFVGGYDAPRSYEGLSRPPAADGTAGDEGTLMPGTNRLDGASGNDDAGNGTRGGDGIDGLDAAGSILNAGKLTLERVGFGGNFARGEVGQGGGFGGPGGSSRAESGATDNVSGLESTGFGLPEEYRQYLLSGAIEGGQGGNGGRGGNGADGGDGGDGGDAAAAILNEGSLTLIDTVFAGRLSSGTLASGNSAHGGYGGQGGAGGYGGSSWGGDGGASGRQHFPEHNDSYGYTWNINYLTNGKPIAVERVGPGEPAGVRITIFTEETSPAGEGGDGGIAGAGGNGGRGGVSGNAATIVNRGALDGTAALINDPGADGSFHNPAESPEGGQAGPAGAGGGSYGGDGGVELGPFKSISYSFELDLDNHERNGTTPPEWVTEVWKEFEANSGYGYDDLPYAGGGAYYTNEGRAPDGEDLARGPSGSLGAPGLSGEAVTGVGGEGTSALAASDTLVYVYDVGQDEETGALTFNIIRVGDVLTDITVDWALTGFGPDPLSAADFAPGTALSGSVSFAALTPADDISLAADALHHVRTVVLDIAADSLPEAPEGYRFALTGIDGEAVLGTREVTGTAVDSPDDGTSETIEGGPGPDDLDGTDGPDVIDAGAGPDTVAPGEGADTITLGEGADTVEGTLAELAGDTVTDFTTEDEIRILGSRIAREAIEVTPGSAILDIDADGDTTPDASITLEGDFSGGDFMAVREAADTRITYETFLPALSEKTAVDEAAVNGINNQPFLTGDGETDFLVSLNDMGRAAYQNVLGVYEIDAEGTLLDARLLFDNVSTDPTAEARITDVEEGHTLGFFLVQNAADWAATLALSATLEILGTSGGAATLADGADIDLAVDGSAVEEIVFHSFASTMNRDGLQHALSGVEEGGEAINVGFEDLTGGGDRDYQDVVFRIEAVDILV